MYLICPVSVLLHPLCTLSLKSFALQYIVLFCRKSLLCSVRFSLLVAKTSSQNSVAVYILNVSSTPIEPEKSPCAFGISAVPKYK